MFERSADAILLLDTHSNLFVEYNQATLDMLRCTREELSALHPSALSPPTQPDGRDSFAKANEMIATALRRGSHRFEWVHRSPHRDDFPVEVLLTPLPLGEAPIVVVMWRDITERKRGEETLRQAQKLESLAVLAGGIAHDFNNLLAAATGHLAAAQAMVGADAAASAHLRRTEQALSHAAHLTHQMLAYSGKASFAIAPLDLGAVALEMAELLHVSVSKHVPIECHVDPALPAIAADRAQVQQLVMNLVTNAGEAIGDGEGVIRVRVTTEELVDTAALLDLGARPVPPGPMVRLEVHDSGAGMSPDVQARIFDPFFSTKQSGRGLGLAAIRGILEAHGAGVRLRSAPGEGTTFQILFPARPDLSSVAPTPPRPSSRGEGTVLLVDDDANVRSSLRAVLELCGFRVLEAASGAEAIALFEARRPEIGWVLMDLTMPRMDGHTAFLRLRVIDPGVVVVLSSGWAADEVAARFAGHPPSGFVGKPFSIEDLQAELRRLGILRAR
ncbi:MAG: response regulator [Myxococcales bacterium]|nr:response regulator [Myxococcales bacterium]